MPRRIHHVRGTLNHRNMQSTHQAGTVTYRAHMHDKVYDNDHLEGGGAQRHGPHTVHRAHRWGASPRSSQPRATHAEGSLVG